MCLSKSKKAWFYTLTEIRFTNNSRSKQNNKNPEHPFAGIGKTETCAKFQSQSLSKFSVFQGNSLFFGHKRALSKFKYWILHHLISIIKLQNTQSAKPNFTLTTQATLSQYLRHCMINIEQKKKKKKREGDFFNIPTKRPFLMYSLNISKIFYPYIIYQQTESFQ